METKNWHLLDHLADHIKQVGGAEYLNDRIFENSYQNFKDFHKETSRQKVGTMDGTLKKSGSKTSRLCSEILFYQLEGRSQLLHESILLSNKTALF